MSLRAGRLVPRASGRRRSAGAGRQFRQRQRVYRRDRRERGRGGWRSGREGDWRPGRRSFHGLHRRDRRAAGGGPHRARPRRARCRRRTRRPDGGGARDHDHRYVPEGRHLARPDRRYRGRRQRHRQRRRHDRARHGDHAVVRVHGRGDSGPRPTGDVVEIRAAFVQRDHGRQRHFHVGHAADIRDRRLRAARRARNRSTPTTRGSAHSSARSTSCCSTSPIKSSATARARASSSR